MAELLIHQVEKGSSLKTEVLLWGERAITNDNLDATTAFSYGSKIGHVERSSFSTKGSYAIEDGLMIMLNTKRYS